MSGQNYGHKQKTNEGYNYPLGPSPFDYYSLKKLPYPPQRIGAGFGTRTMRDVMEWQNTMGSTPYPWGPDGRQFMFYRK